MNDRKFWFLLGSDCTASLIGCLVSAPFLYQSVRAQLATPGVVPDVDSVRSGLHDETEAYDSDEDDDDDSVSSSPEHRLRGWTGFLRLAGRTVLSTAIKPLVYSIKIPPAIAPPLLVSWVYSIVTPMLVYPLETLYVWRVAPARALQHAEQRRRAAEQDEENKRPTYEQLIALERSQPSPSAVRLFYYSVARVVRDMWQGAGLKLLVHVLYLGVAARLQPILHARFLRLRADPAAPLSLLEELLVAGAISLLPLFLTHPLERLKTIAQANAAVHYRESVSRAVWRTCQKKGGVRRLLFAGAVSRSVAHLLQFWLTAVCKQLIGSLVLLYLEGDNAPVVGGAIPPPMPVIRK